MENRLKLNIKQWAEEDRPREKMMEKGANALSEAELLAILIGSGNKEETAVELMKRVLASCNNDLNELAKWDMRNFSAFKGVGPAKSVTIMAALELGRRRKLSGAKERLQITCSQDVYLLFQPIMRDLSQEELWLLLLNQSNKVINKVRISTGGIDGTYADVRTILREALMQRATGMILIHNHPSGNPRPSQEDKRLTSHVNEGSRTMNIRLSDHVIICDGKFYSFADEGEII